MVRQSTLKYKVGKLCQSDLLQQKENVETTRLAYVQQQNELEQNYQSFLQAIGLVATANLKIETHISYQQDQVPNREVCIRLALEHNIAYQSAVIQLM